MAQAPAVATIRQEFEDRFAGSLALHGRSRTIIPGGITHDGRYLRRTVRVVKVRWVEQTSDVELIYYVRTGSSVERVVQAFPMRWYTPSELEHLLARAGFRVEGTYGDFARGSLTDESPEIVVVATRDGRPSGQ
jgi:hypothetical protein